MAAPAGVRLGFDTLIPLLGVVMTPVTLAFGPSASLSLLTIMVPGLACYAMYRAARLWLRSQSRQLLDRISDKWLFEVSRGGVTT